MDDPSALAGLASSVANVVAAYMGELARHAGEGVVDRVGRDAYNLIKERLSQDDFGRGALSRVEEHPADPRSSAALQLAIQEAITIDRELATQLRKLIDERPANGQTASHMTQNVHAKVVRGSNIAGRDVNIKNLRRWQISSLGLGAGLVVVATLLIGTLTHAAQLPFGRSTVTPSQDPTLKSRAGVAPSTSVTQLPRPHTGPTVAVNIGGFRYSIGAIAVGTDPNGLPPGQTSVYVDYVITNLQEDRSAPYPSLFGGGPVTPYVPQDHDPLRSGFNCTNTVLEGWCSESERFCYRMDKANAPQIDSFSNTMSVRDSWTVHCQPTGAVFEPLDPRTIRLFACNSGQAPAGCGDRRAWTEIHTP